MFKRTQIFKPNAQAARHEAAILALVSVCVSVVLVWKAPDFWAIFVSELGRAFQYVGANTHLQIVMALRYQTDLFQNLATQVVTKGEWACLETGPRPIPFEIRIKSAVMIAACDISVIIPTLNEEKYLPRCLESLVNESRKAPAEIIVVDGGSKDGSVQLAKQYADKVLLEPARPVGAARNVGAKHAEGEILAFIDADTMAGKNWLEEIAETFRSTRRAVGVTGPTHPYEGTQLDKLAYHVATGWAQRLSLRFGRPHVAGLNCAYRRKAFWDAGGFDENRVLSEDVMLSLRMRHQGQIVFNPEMIAYTSLRRIKKYGYLYLTTYYAINGAMMVLFDRTLGYPQVR